MTVAQPSEAGARRPRFSATDRFMLRMALAATLGFAIALSLGWNFSFLAPMLAVQLVAATPGFPSLGQGLFMPIVMWVGTTLAMLAASLLAHAPAVQLLILAVVIFFTFYAKRRGAPAVMVLFLQIAFCIVPLYATASLDLAQSLAGFLQRSAVAAAVVLFVCHLLVPAPPQPSRPTATAGDPALMSRTEAAKVALADSLVLLPLLATFMLGADTGNFVILMMTMNILNDLDPGRSRLMAIGLLVGNTVGGLLAVAAQQFVFLADTLVFFLLTVFLSTLWFARKAVRGGTAAPLFGVALGTYLLILGLAITPLPGGSAQSYVVRILQIAFAGLYALAALSIMAPLREVRRQPPIPGDAVA